MTKINAEEYFLCIFENRVIDETHIAQSLTGIPGQYSAKILYTIIHWVSLGIP